MSINISRTQFTTYFCIFCCLGGLLGASCFFIKKQRYEQVTSKLTIVVTTNPIPTIPSTDIIYRSMESFYKVQEMRKCKKIIVFDGVQPNFTGRESDYDQYKQNVASLVKSSPFFQNTELVFCDKWSHISGAIAQALTHVSTPFIFVHQHDFILQKKIDVVNLIKTMDMNPAIKYVRLNQWKNLPHKKTGFHYSFDGDVDTDVPGPTKVALCRTFGWSDNDHFARTDYYSDFVLPNCQFGAMEWFLEPMLKNAIREKGKVGHAPFGTFLLGGLKDGRHIRHIDGRLTTSHDKNNSQ